MDTESEHQESGLKSFLKRLKMSESTISMALGALVVVVVGVLVYNYFSSVNKQPATDQVAYEGVQLVKENGKLVPQGLPKTHKVTNGEHLWQIAEKYYESGYNWVNIAQENQLIAPYVIVEGQELTIPKTAQIVVEKPEVKVTETTSTQDSILTDNYTVAKGDTLWKIAVRAYGDGYQWTKIFKANQEQIVDSNVIEKGMVLKLPR